jgi:hypothetical protein
MLSEKEKGRIIKTMKRAPILISKAALLARLNDRAGVRAIDSWYAKRPDGRDVLLIYYDNYEVREFKGLRAA